MSYTVETRVLSIDPYNPDPETIQVAAAALKAGGLVAFPTETVYGLGANALDAEAVRRIYRAKARPANNPLIVHIAAPEQVDQVAVDVPPVARQLIAAFWPGPLTVVLKRAPHVPANISAGRETIAVRMPAHAVALALIQASGVPIAAPSANLFTRPSATKAEHVLADLGGRVDVLLDGGPTVIGLESTVIDLTVETPIVLRPGGVTIESLGVILPVIELHRQALGEDETAPASPGMLAKHYSPEAELILFSGAAAPVTARMQQTAREHLAAGRAVGALLVDEDRAIFDGLNVPVVSLGPKTDLAQVGRNLFAALRALDSMGVDVILARSFESTGLGATITDRLTRAAEGHVVEVTG
ncbi:MAG: threonylcarbamoyl-AMP synthase [Anaerolineae bacterium]|nr:threonylcarbamoyl-AMP synthase [Anaerolineae bacterium]